MVGVLVMEGLAVVGGADGCPDGEVDGSAVGGEDGTTVGATVDPALGGLDGAAVGRAVGPAVGRVGAVVGAKYVWTGPFTCV